MKSIKIRQLTGILCALCLNSCTEENPSFTAGYETVNEAVYASGEILPDPYLFIQSATNEVISLICVGVGDNVKEGDVVAFLGSSNDDRHITSLKEQLAIAKVSAGNNSPVLNELLLKIEAVKGKYESDKRNAQRYSTLAQSNAVSQKDAEHYALQAETSLIEYTRLQELYNAKINELSGTKLEIESLLAQANITLEDRILRSKINGKVLSIPKKEGESVNPDEIIMLIGNDSCFRLNLIIDERDIHKIKIGQKIVFETDAYPNRLFHATLGYIDPLINTELRSIKAEASIDGDTFFYPQSNIEANIITREKQRAILIPSDYLFSGDSVLVRQNNNIQMKKVVSGIRVGSNVEITDGINEGDVIFRYKE